MLLANLIFLQIIKKHQHDSCNFFPRKEVKDFFNYGNTKMSSFSRDFNVRTAKVGKRVFYRYEDIVKLFESNI